MSTTKILMTICLLPAAVLPPAAQAAERVWTGAAGNANWFTTNNWTPDDSYPVAGDTATITNGTVLLTNSSAYLSALTITDATLVFSNWDTTLSATNVVIGSNGIMTLSAAFTNNVMSNRVSIACSNLTLDVWGQINASDKGYIDGIIKADGSGPGGGYYSTYSDSGAGHGGQGGYSASLKAGGVTYGSSSAPTTPGSGGGGGQDIGEEGGGGALRIDASGAIVLNGTISANGRNGVNKLHSSPGGGSGGSIFITSRTFGGAVGAILAQGGTSTYKGTVATWGGGGGGGGRIAVWCGLSDQLKARALTGNLAGLVLATNFAKFSGTLSVTNGMGYTSSSPGGAEAGTILFISSMPGGNRLLFQMRITNDIPSARPAATNLSTRVLLATRFVSLETAVPAVSLLIRRAGVAEGMPRSTGEWQCLALVALG